MSQATTDGVDDKSPRGHGGRGAARLPLAMIVSLGLVALAACGGSTPESPSAPAPSAAAPSASSAAAPTSPATSEAPKEVTKLNIVAFRPPSLGAFLPAVIEKQDTDASHGLEISYTYATPDNYNTEFGAGHFDLGGSAGLLSEALRTQRGVDVTYLFNINDFFGTVVTSKPDVTSLKDLEGKTLAAATGTTNFAMFKWFAGKEGVDVSRIKLMNQTTSGLSTMAQTGRSDAVELWEPAYSTLVGQNDKIRTIDLDLKKWSEAFGTSDIPYLGMAAQNKWATANPEIVQALYDTYKEAAQWVLDNPDEASKIIAATIPSGSAAVIKKLIENNDDTLQLRVLPASEVAKGMNGVFKAGVEIGYLEKEPPESIIFQGIKP